MTMPPTRACLAITLAAVCACTTAPPPPPAGPTAEDYVGRWNVRLADTGDTMASGQIDIAREGEALTGALVWRWGSYAPADRVEVKEGVLHLARKAEKEGEDVFEARLVDGMLKGTACYPDGTTHTFEGRLAPALATTGEPEWGEPVTLFDGKTLEGWSLRDPDAEMGWAVVDGELAVVEPEGNADLMTDQTFQDMKVHIEFNVAPESNSGVFLRGRYEIQIEGADPDSGKDTQKCGSLYSRIAPTHDATKPAGEWQSYDITLVGRELTVELNGETVVEGTVEGITGSALNPFEDEPGPLMLQGDHGKIRFRNVVVTPAS